MGAIVAVQSNQALPLGFRGPVQTGKRQGADVEERRRAALEWCCLLAMPLLP
jgi:hypothetical protein